MLSRVAIFSAVVMSLGLAAIGFAQTPTSQTTSQTPTDPQEKRHQADVAGDIAMGKKYMLEVEKQTKPSKDKAFQERVERVGQAIANIANHNHVRALWGDSRLSKFDYTYKVLEGDDINAFSLPGGHIYVYEGLMRFVESDDELAGVLAHETAHAALRHVATLQREASKAQIYQIPMIIAAVLARSPEAANVVQLHGLSMESGWSINAEKAADYGGFQYMLKSPYNPVAMLTFMERLARKESFLSKLERNLGILQTHPLTRDRADAMMQNLQSADIPVARSKASPSYRVTLKDGFDGAVDAFFGDHKIYTFGGNEARERAELAAKRLNDFFDSVPEPFDVTAENEEIVGRGQMLIKVEPDDAVATKLSEEQTRAKAVSSIKQSLFRLAYRVWDGW